MTVDDKTLPQIPDVVAHRGYSSKYPENTLIAFEKAIEANASALEGDIRLSKDGEIVMMHDLTLNRTTTGTGNVGDRDWHGYIDGLTTKTDPPQPIPRFKDIVRLLLRPEVVDRNMYMIVDIKFDNPIEILDAVQKLLTEEFSEHLEVLAKQLVIGIWHVDFLPRTQSLFTGFRICFIGLSLEAARKHFLKTADYLSMPFAALADADGQSFIKEAHALGKRVFTWTVNDVEQMHTCVVWGVDAVIGDHIDTMTKHVRHTMTTPEEFKQFAESCTYLSHRRTRLYYYLLKKVMYYASRGYIGM